MIDEPAPTAARRPWVIAVCALLSGVLGAMLLAVSVPLLWGWHSVAVTSGSMGAAVSAGDVVLVAPLRAGDPMPDAGDIVQVADPGRPGYDYLHRVVGYVAGGAMVTKGDANASVDSVPVTRSDLRGVARMRVPWLGKLAMQQGGDGVALGAAVVLVVLGAGLVVARLFVAGAFAATRNRVGRGLHSLGGGLDRFGRRLRRPRRGPRRPGGLVRPGETPWVATTGVVALLSLVVPAVLGSTAAVFSSATGTGPNTLAAAATFLAYPDAVIASNPDFYYRMDEGFPNVSGMATDTTGKTINTRFDPDVNLRGATARWQFDEGSGTTAFDSAAGTFTLSQNAGTSAWNAAGHTGKALSLNGTASAGSMATSAPVLSTAASFSVSAWVKPVDAAGTGTIVSQSGANAAGFALQYNGSAKTFQFVRASNDANSPTSTYVVTSPPVSDFSGWHFVVGVYDAIAKTMTIYADSDNAGQSIAGLPALWSANGPLMVGRALAAGVPANPFNGLIDDVMTHGYAMSQGDRSNLFSGATTYGAWGANQRGALVGAGASSPALSFDGSKETNFNTARIFLDRVSSAPAALTVELWFRTRSTTGATLITYYADQNSRDRTDAQRAVYLDSTGKITFLAGTDATNAKSLQSAGTYNDGAWHYLAASIGTNMRLDVDDTSVSGVKPAAETLGTNGPWIIGHGLLPTWAQNRPTATVPGAYGSVILDEVAKYPTQLSITDVNAHRAANA